MHTVRSLLTHKPTSARVVPLQLRTGVKPRLLTTAVITDFVATCVLLGAIPPCDNAD